MADHTKNGSVPECETTFIEEGLTIPENGFSARNYIQQDSTMTANMLSDHHGIEAVRASAIDDDDDSSDLESSLGDSGHSVNHEFKVQRIKPELTSRRSLITLMLAQGNRGQRLGNNASQSTSTLPHPHATLNSPVVNYPNDSDKALVMKRCTRASPMRPTNEVPRASAQPIDITTTGMNHQAALSPRTTRRNMLAAELTKSLRQQLLSERSQLTANAVLKRRHTSHDVANLKQHPERPYMNERNNVDDGLDFGDTGYHARGW
ncbi:hypothetical protein B0T14DRAFT_600444 [Immersiella caudata]|uniref:DUF3295 domain-containing protein n=1 Tax=Immersiella caudata TaxID=314043 RepID=A0AA40C777_9PEZI|nr:hypothetical protein B0T14DRAFT_600444 [Immersiella caudata]